MSLVGESDFGENNLVNVDEKFRDELLKRIERIKQGERDLYF